MLTHSSLRTPMDHLLLLLSFFTVAVATGDEALPAQLLYWNKALPNTPIPGAIHDILFHNADVKASPSLVTNSGQYRAVMEKDMLAGTKVIMHFMRTTAGLGVTFLPRQSASSIPFSTSKLPEILSHFSLTPDSIQAQSIKKTLSECDAPAAEGEDKFCATSLESMVEYTTSVLQTRNIRAVSTTMTKQDTPDQEYIVSSVTKLKGPNFVACHARKYEYAVFYCHTTQGITAYQASLIGKDGTQAEAAAVCHTGAVVGPDSESYMKGLKIRPGNNPICHYLPQDHIVFSPNN